MAMQFLSGARVHLGEVDPSTGALAGNVGLHVGDDPALVRARREAMARRLGRDIVWMNQTHSTRVETIVHTDRVPMLAGAGTALARPALGEWGPVEADGVVIDARGWRSAPALAVQTADCLPVVLSAARGEVVAAVHAGRRGLLGGILTTAVEQIRSLTDEAILALICGRCYEVPEHMASESEAAMPGIRARTSWGTPSLDLSAAASTQLRELGVRVLTDPRCTLEDSDLFSYRADSGCGRQALIIIPV